MAASGSLAAVRGGVTLAGRWKAGAREFADPIREIAADKPQKVLAALANAEAVARSGFWVAGFVAYEAAPALDSRLRVIEGTSGLPLVWFGVYEAPVRPSAARGEFSLGHWSPAMSPAAHRGRVASIKGAIRAGDTYQVNLTFPMTARFEGEPGALFDVMRSAQPGSYAAMIDLGDRQVLSVSPELFLSLDARVVTARPMKGTAPRGRWPAEDQGMAEALQMSEKERAGNVMIVDLVRNDLGRVAEFGSVHVPGLFETERHPTVWQLTSTVESRLRDDVGLAELFVATFPSGSVTGAPKASTMNIISEHEVSPRGAYCGAIGYIEPGGTSAEFSVAIRTGVVAGETFAYHVGGGITYDSTAETEYEECLWKARVVTEPVTVPGLVETMRYEPGIGIELLDGHVARLSASADYWGIEFDPTSLGDALSAVGSSRPTRVRLLLHPDGSTEVEIEELSFDSGTVALKWSEVRVDATDPIWFHKTMDRGRYPETGEGVEVVLANSDGYVTETNRSSLMIRFGADWVTPPIEMGLLPGVFRSHLLGEGRARERPVTIDEFTMADEYAVVNALRGWRNAKLIE